jgi:hypothetical protein
MTTMGATAFSGFARRTAEFVSDFASVIRKWTCATATDPGSTTCGPGPKWHAKHQRWLRFDSEAVSPDGQRQLSPVHIRRRNAANTTR